MVIKCVIGNITNESEANFANSEFFTTTMFAMGQPLAISDDHIKTIIKSIIGEATGRHEIRSCKEPQNLWIPGACPEFCHLNPTSFLCDYVTRVPALDLHVSISPSSLIYLTYQNNLTESIKKLKAEGSTIRKFAIFQVSSKKGGYNCSGIEYLALWKQFYVAIFYA